MTSASSSTPRPAIAQDVLIVGGDGTIGSALNKRLLADGYEVACSTRRPGNHGDVSPYIDLQDPGSFLSIENRLFETVVLCGAITSIQQCQQNPEKTKQVNVEGTLELAALLAKSGSHLVFLSTNLVFDGSKPHSKASDTKNPTTEYGRQKAAVEDGLLALSRNVVVIRLGKVLTPNFPLFAEWLERLQSGNCIHPHANRAMAPISLAFATDILAWLIAEKKNGIFQATASYDITYADAAFMLARLSQIDPSLVEPIDAPLPQDTNSTHHYTTLEFSPDFAPFFSQPQPSQALRYAIQ